MAKSPKQEPRKTVWRGISVKADSRPSSTQSHDSSLSWERQPLSPLSQEYSASIKTPPGTPMPEDHQHAMLQHHELAHHSLNDQRHSSSISISPSNSTTVSSTKSSSNSSSKHKKEKLASLGSLTKTYDPSHTDLDSSSPSRKKKGHKEGRATTLGSLTKPYEQSERRAQKEQERKERKEREKLERQARKDQQKLDKELKEQHKKELKLLKEKERQERKDRKLKTKSSIFSRSSSKLSSPTDADMHEIIQDEAAAASTVLPSLASLPSKSNSDPHLNIAVSGSTLDASFQDIITDESSSEEFVDFADSHTTVHAVSGLILQQEVKDSTTYQHQHIHPVKQSSTSSSLSDYTPQSSLQPRPRSKAKALKLLGYAQQQQQHEIDPITTTFSSKPTTPTLQDNTANSMFYILNSLQDAGRNIEDDDMLDDLAAKKMDATQQPRSSFSYQRRDMPGQQFDQHIQALEIMANRTSISAPPTDPLPPLPTGQRSPRHIYSSGGDHRLSVDSQQSSPAQNTHSSSRNGRLSVSSRLSHGSSASSASYDTVAHTDHHHSSPGIGSQDQTRGQDHQPHQQRRHRSNSHHHSPLASPYGITAISEEELMVIAPAPGSLSISTTAIGDHQHKSNDDALLDSPIDEYITNENSNISSSSSNHQMGSDNTPGDSDSCSFESTDIPDPFLFPSDDSDTQQRSSVDPQKRTDETKPSDLQHKWTSNSDTTSKKNKTIMDEALKVRTSDNVSGRQVPVMQVNISHDPVFPTANHPTLLAPMSAVIESTLPSPTIDQPIPLRQSSLPLSVEKVPSSAPAVPLEEEKHQNSPISTEPPATVAPPRFHPTAIMDTEDHVVANILKPRQQEEADQPIRQGMKYLFGNKFTKAIAAFKAKVESEPLHALGLGSMLLLKAMMTNNGNDVDSAMDALAHASTIAGTQAELSEETFDNTFSSQISSLVASTEGDQSSFKTFKSNGVLRALVIQAESHLLMGILQLTQENMAGYLKCGLNIKKACTGYNVVWKEYQRMGEQVSEWMDENTVSAVQFGVGTLHLLFSSLPEKILTLFSGLSWRTDKELGFSLLKSAMTGQGTRSSFASLMLLSYYSVLSSAVPSIYAQASIQATIECLVAAQKSHPKSCFFLYYAARISRVARNVGLSTQSFTMATASTRRGAWAEVAMKHTTAYEVGLNHAMQLDWDTSAAYFEQLCCARDWSPAFCQYFVGASHEMLGQRQEAKDAFNEVPIISHQQHHRKSFLDNYVQVKVEQYQSQEYADLDSSLPGLELLLLLNGFGAMEDAALRRCLVMIEETCQLIGGGDSDDGAVRMTRYGTLLLLKCATLNALSRHKECVPHLDWLQNNKRFMETEDWLLPFVYWEAGVTYWGLDDHEQSKALWQLALSCTRYDFEFRMASRIHLALEKCDELGVPESNPASGRKRL